MKTPIHKRNRIIELYSTGLTLYKVHEITGVSEITISKILDEEGIKRKPIGLRGMEKEILEDYAQYLSHSMIAEKYNIPESNVQKFLQKYYTKEELRERIRYHRKLQVVASGSQCYNWKGGKQEFNCSYCGKIVKKHRSAVKDNSLIFCSIECRSMYNTYRQLGKDNPMYKNGSSYGDYCEKFNAEFKRRVRAYMGNECIICGITKEQNNNRNIGVHHVFSNKQACCDDTPPMFALLCMSCHFRETHYHEYTDIIIKKIQDQFGGKCFYTKEEYKELVLSGEIKIVPIRKQKQVINSSYEQLSE